MAYLVHDPAMEKLIGATLLITGAYLLYEAYEKRGRRRPFALRFLPGGGI